jgi:Zn-dependent peptidase ImmA (M78 family)
MTRSEYYASLRGLARSKRAEYGISTPSLNIAAVRRIYKAEGITVDLRSASPRIRAAYYCDEGDISVLVNKNLPKTPRLFAMVHELKHHYCDQELISSGEIQCGDYNANQVIEIGAEEFAAEFIYPEAEMRALVDDMGITAENCSAERVIKFKRKCPAQVSYQFLTKRFERLGLCAKGTFAGVQFQKREEELYGRPFYKQTWFKDHRKGRAGR